LVHPCPRQGDGPRHAGTVLGRRGADSTARRGGLHRAPASDGRLPALSAHPLYLRAAAVTAALLRAEGLTAGYGKVPILHDVTLEVRAGEMVSVIGPNGAGKSTAFKTIVGFVHATSGRVTFAGEEITGLRPDQVLPRGLAYVPQGRIVFPQMTVLENLE